MFPLKFFITILVSIMAVLSLSAAAGSSSRSLTRLQMNPIAPEFILQDINGRQHALSDYRGKVVVINFWATWCPPCIAEMPSMQRAADKLAKHDIPIIGIGAGETRKRVLRFLKDTPIRFPLLLDTKSEVMEAWSALTLPTTFVINQKGRMVFLAVGKREWDSPRILEQILSLKKKQ